MFVQGPLSFYAVRFLLGIAEAGFFPGMILYLSYWFPARERARAVGVFMSRDRDLLRDRRADLRRDHVRVRRRRRPRGLAVAVRASRRSPRSSPASSCSGSCPTARRTRAGSSPRRRRWLAERLEGEEQQRLARERHSLGEVLKDRRVLVFALLYFTMVINVYGLSFWVGEIVDQINGSATSTKGFVTAIPYAVAIIGMVVIPRYSDRTGERKRVVAACLALAAVAFVVSTVVGPVAAIAALAVGLFFLLGVHGVFWTMPAALLSGAAAAAGIAMINSIGNLGGFVGPYLVGLVKDATGSTDGGLIVLAAILVVGSITRPASSRTTRSSSARRRRAPAASTARASPSARRTEYSTHVRLLVERGASYLAALMYRNGFPQC